MELLVKPRLLRKSGWFLRQLLQNTQMAARLRGSEREWFLPADLLRL
jgi:hypothetical protein